MQPSKHLVAVRKMIVEIMTDNSPFGSFRSVCGKMLFSFQIMSETPDSKQKGCAHVGSWKVAETSVHQLVMCTQSSPSLPFFLADIICHLNILTCPQWRRLWARAYADRWQTKLRLAQRIKYNTFVTKTPIMKNDLLEITATYFFYFKKPTSIKLSLPLLIMST